MFNRNVILFTWVVCFAFNFLKPELGFAKANKKEEEPPLGRILISFEPQGGQEAWIAKALEQNVYKDLAGFERIVGINKDEINTDTCPNGELSCLIGIYKANEIDVLMVGKVYRRKVEYKIYELYTASLVKKGSIPIGPRSSIVKIRLNTFQALKPFLEKGGILDQNKFRKEQKLDSSLDTPVFFKHISKNHFKIIILVLFIMFFLFPFLFPSTFLKSVNINLPIKQYKSSTKWVLLLILILLGALAYQIFEIQSGRQIFSLSLIRSYLSFENYMWIIAIIGGMAWAWFVILNFKLLFPGLIGIERIQGRVLFPFIRNWMFVSFLRIMGALLFYIPFLIIVWNVGKLFGASNRFIVTIFIPFSGLLVYFWFVTLVENLSHHLDKKFCIGPPTEDNHWHESTKKYFIGYLRRIGIPFDRELIDRTLFLPGNIAGAVNYGGGFTRPRIVISQDLLRLAMEDASIQKTDILDLDYKDSILGLQIPKRQDVYRVKNIDDALREIYSISKVRTKDKKWIDLSENKTTLQGLVLPRGMGQSVPLVADNKGDLLVVEDLLLLKDKEVSPSDEEMEYDTTNIEDKDFLFGLLLQQFGSLIRFDSLALTFFLTFGKPVYTENSFDKREYFSERSVPGSSSIIEDSFVALNYGLHHFIQYLYLQRTGFTDHLTTRASSQDLFSATNDILEEMKREKFLLYNLAKEKNRRQITWLAQFLEKPILDPEPEPMRQFVNMSTIGVLSLFVLYVLINSYNYHPIYLEKIAEEKAKIEEMKKKYEQEENSYVR